MAALREQMAEDMRLKGFAQTTQAAYLLRAKHLAAHYMRSPSQLGREEVRKFLRFVVMEQQAKPTTVRMYVAAIKFLYATTLGRPGVVAGIPWPKVPRTLPDILSAQEVIELLTAMARPKHRAMALTAYGAGLRVSEVCSLKAVDVDSSRMLLHVRKGKRSKDRYVMLSENLLEGLREYWRRTRPSGEYLFPGAQPGSHISASAFQQMMRKVVRRCDFGKRVTPHSLRHAFATHLLENGEDIRTIQVLLGHSSVQSTAVYTKVSIRHIGRTRSPLDVIGRQAAAGTR